MRFLCFSDLHGGVPDLTVPVRPDALIFAGDLGVAARKIAELFPGVPVFGVPGNHDDLANPFCGAPVTNLHGKVVEFKGLRIGGLGGSLRYKPGGRWLFWDSEYAEILDGMPPVDIFVSHCPPVGLPWCDPPVGDRWHDPHEGSVSLAEYVSRMGPAVLICGHLHVRGEFRLGRTLVRQVHGVELLELRKFGLRAGAAGVDGNW